MLRCDRDGCGWVAIAASPAGEREQLATHLVEEHGTAADADIPDGMVEVRAHPDDEWQIVTLDEAKRLHERRHEDR